MGLFSIPRLKSRPVNLDKRLIKNELVRLSEGKGEYDIFLSHKIEDAELVYALKRELDELGYRTYVDWCDTSSPQRDDVNASTASFIKDKIKRCKTLFYVHSAASQASKWMPWEMGIKDGHNGKVLVLPLLSSNIDTNSYSGTEYLGIYPYVTTDTDKGGTKRLWVHTAANCYVSFNKWLEGEKPYVRS